MTEVRRFFLLFLSLFCGLASAVTINVQKPVANGTWGVAVPGYHNTWVGNYSTDIYAASGSAVSVAIDQLPPRAYLHVVNIGDVNCGSSHAGKYVTIGVYSGVNGSGTRYGTLHYAHLRNVPNSVRRWSDISIDTIIGYTHQWPYSSCYQVSSPQHVHVHMEIGGSSGHRGAIIGYKSGQSVPHWLGQISNCGTDCSRCVLGTRKDILPAFISWGWNGACHNHQAIVEEWSNIDPPGSLGVMNDYCPKSCDGTCGSACTHCILDERTDILPAFSSWGWDTSCGNRNAVVDEWCKIDPAGCSQVKTSRCSLKCN